MSLRLQELQEALRSFNSPEGAAQFFRKLGYPLELLSHDLSHLPESAQKAVASLQQLVQLNVGFLFRIFHAQLKTNAIRRTDIRRFLEAFYRHQPQGENLFVFSPEGSFEELAFVSPRRIPDPRDSMKVRLWLRILQVRRTNPYRTDLEVLSRICADDAKTSDEIWKRHEEAFSVQRVTEQFFKDYSEIFYRIRKHLHDTHKQNGAKWAHDYTHQLLNRIMFIYFIARKGWLLGPDGTPDRDFMRHFWEAYQQSNSKDKFHTEWLPVLFFEAFNNRWQNRHEYLERFPQWLLDAFAQAPYLNGGLYTRRPDLDDRLRTPLPDEFFSLLFEEWTDHTTPGFFERYNFTVVETGRFDEEVAVDPEMLGTVYERLVNITYETDEKGPSAVDTKDLRGTAGIFYTPRIEIDLMCRLALVDWLSNQLGNDKKDLLYQWVFAFSEEEKAEADQEVTKEGLWETLSNLVRKVRVCDPACGSGSFLVGMMLVLDDLRARCNAVLGENKTPYERRKSILQDQLYGVDVMEWAVRVAELRLWLQLVVETELERQELKDRPLLPNLDFKLRPGDSLLQTVGDLDLSPFRRSELPLPRHLKGRLTQLKGKKRRFFQGEDEGLVAQTLKQEEFTLFCDILESRIHALDGQIKTKRLEAQTRQLALSGMGTPLNKAENHQLEKEIKALEEDKARYEQALSTLRALRPDQPPPFVWDLAFVEIFEDDDPGFDIVIGNPPYVRQEKIRDYLERFDRKEYLRRLNESLRAIYPDFMGKIGQISGRADYYLYFYLHALSLLAEKGTFCFITSNSWLDVDFGKDLQEFFLRYGHLKMVIDNRAKRSFAQADVNTVIVLAGPPERKRPLTEQQMRERQVRFVAFRVPFEEAISPVVFMEIEDEASYQSLAGFRVLTRPEFRAVLHDQWSLYQEGLEEREERQFFKADRYAGNKWGGKYLRAPDIFFTILEKGKGKLVRLGDIAEVRFGIKTGANEFFYLEPIGLTVKEVAELREKNPYAPVRVKNGAGWEGKIEAAWLRPVIKSPREIKTLRVRLEDLHYLIFMPPDDVRKAIEKGHHKPWRSYPLAAEYIRWGEAQGYQNRPTCASRQWWWDVGERKPASLHWIYIVRERLCRPYSKHIFVGDEFFDVYYENESLVALCNTTLLDLMAEITARHYGGGGGPLKSQVYEVEKLLVPDPQAFDQSTNQYLLETFEKRAQRNLHSIFEDLGFAPCRERGCKHPEHPYEFVKPEKLTLEQVRKASPDRFELDRVVFDVLGLTDKERLEVYQAVAQLVKDRLVKAGSV